MRDEYLIQSYPLSLAKEDDISKYLSIIEDIYITAIYNTNSTIPEYIVYTGGKQINSTTKFCIELTLRNSEYFTIVQTKDVKAFCISYRDYFNPHKLGIGLVPALLACNSHDPKICFKLYKELKRLALANNCAWYGVSHRVAPFTYTFKYIDL